MVVLMKDISRLLMSGLGASMIMGMAQEPLAKPDKTISISAERFAFSPSRIRIAQGAVVELVITSEDTDHGFRIPKANIDVTIPQQGKSEIRVRFVAKEKGEYVYECSRPCGAGHNLMRGRIVVQ